jgi:nicotinamidase-related amidase
VESVLHGGGGDAVTALDEPSALIVIDPQVDFLPMLEDGASDTCGPEAALTNIATLLASARSAGLPVIFTQELHRRELVDFGRELDGDEPIHCLEDSPGAEIVPELAPLEGEWTIRKRRYSAFFATDLDLLLRGLGVRTIVACGFLTDVCVHYTCVDAHQHDYRVIAVRDACGGSSAEASRASFAAIEYLQRGSIVTLAEVASELEQRRLVSY